MCCTSRWSPIEARALFDRNDNQLWAQLQITFSFCLLVWAHVTTPLHVTLTTAVYDACICNKQPLRYRYNPWSGSQAYGWCPDFNLKLSQLNDRLRALVARLTTYALRTYFLQSSAVLTHKEANGSFTNSNDPFATSARSWNFTYSPNH